MTKHNYSFPAIKNRWSGVMNLMDFSWHGASGGFSNNWFFRKDLMK